MNRRLRQRLRFPALFVGVVGLTVALLRGSVAWTGGSEPLPDPVPLRRIVLPPSRLALEVEKAAPGVLIPLPRDEFESRLRKIAQLKEASAAPPRLVKARYVAELKGNALVGRSGAWTVEAGGGPGVLPLPTLNLALGTMRNVHGAEVLLGDLDGKNLGLWVDEPTDIFFDWSVRGVPRPDGLAFDLRLPPALTGTLELILPDEFTLSAQDLPVSGPREVEVKGKNAWSLQIGGRSQVELSLRRNLEGERTAGAVLAQAHTRVQVWPQAQAADFEFQIDLLHTGARELLLRCDPDLEPYEITARTADVVGWDIRDGKAPDPKKKGETIGQRQIVVRLREPARGPLAGLRVRCLGAWSDAAAWKCPHMALEGGILRGETIKLTFAPELQLQDWSAGAFRLLGATTDPDGGQALNLESALLRLGDSARPSGRLLSKGTRLHAESRLRWSVQPTRETLDMDLSLTAERGRLDQIACALPKQPGWTVDVVEAEAKDRIRAWNQDGALLLMELSKGLTPPEPLRLRLRLTRPLPFSTKERVLDFPEFQVVNASSRKDELRIDLHSALRARILSSSVAPVPAPDGLAPPLFYFSVPERAITGKLLVGPDQSRLAVRLLHEAQWTSPPHVRVKLQIEPLSGLSPAVDLLSGIQGVSWRLEEKPGEPAARVERNPRHGLSAPLRLLGGAHPLDRLALAATQSTGEWWRLRLPGPVQENISVVLTAPLVAGKDGAFHVPLLAVPNAERQEGLVRLGSPTGALQETQAVGLRPGAGNESYRFGATLHAPLLSVQTTAHSAGATLCDRATWITYLEPGKGPEHCFSFDIWNWRERLLPVLLPPDSELISVRAADHWQEATATKVVPEGVRVSIPTGGAKRQRIVIRYRSVAGERSMAPWWSVALVEPTPPTPPLRSTRVWRLHPDLIPLDQGLFSGTRGLMRLPAGEIDLGKVWHAADSLLPETGSTAHPEDRSVQVLLGAEAALRKRLTPESTLGQALGMLWQDENVRALPLVVDQDALLQAGVSTGSALASFPKGASGKPFWDSLGLVWIPGRSVVLTTRAKDAAMQKNWGRNWHALFEDSAVLAERSGKDFDGALVSLAPWLFGLPPGLFPDNPSLADDDDFAGERTPLGGWREYQPLPGTTPPGEMVVARIFSLHLIGVGLAILSVVAFLLSRGRAGPWRSRLFLIAFAAAAAAMVRLPNGWRLCFIWPLLTLGLILCWTYGSLLTRRGGAAGSPSTASAVKVTGAVAGLCLVLLAGMPQGAAQPAKVETYTVFLVPTDGGKQTALVTPDLLKKLDELESKTTPRTVHAVLLGAEYQGRWQGAAFEVRARFDLHSDAETATLHLPLTGIEIKEGALLDGAPVFPTPAPAAKGGFHVPIHGKGRRRLELTGLVRLGAAADFQEIRVGIPRLPRSRIDFQVPLSLGAPVLVACQGEEQVRDDKTMREIQANLGREAALHLRFPSGVPATSAAAEVREMYFWDLRPLSATLNGVLQYTISKGTLSQLSFDVPEGMDVRGVELLTFSGGAGAGTPALRSWRLEGKEPKRQLHLDPGAALTGRFQVNLSLAPRLRAVEQTLSLRLPTPVKIKIAESSLAYRLDGLESKETPVNLTYTLIAPEQFAKLWKAAGQRETATSITKALTFRRSGAPNGFQLTLQPVAPRGSADLRWTAHGDRAELLATFTLSATRDEELSLIEIRVPKDLHITQVLGPNLHHWSRQDDNLQVWLASAKPKAILEVRGWKEAAKTGAPTISKVNLPIVALAAVKLPQTRVSLEPAPGFQLGAVAAKGMTRAPAPLPPALRYEATGPGANLTLEVHRDDSDTRTQAVTSVELRDGMWRVRLSGRWHSFRTEPRDIAVALNGALGRSAQLSAGPDVDVRKDPGAPARWTLHPRGKAISMPLHFTIEYQAPAASPFVFAVPGLTVDGKAPDEETVTLDAGLKLKNAGRLTPVKEAKAARAVDRAVWRRTGAADAIVVEASGLSSDPALDIRLGQQQALFTLEGRWLHEAAFLVTSRRDNELRFRLPDTARLRAVALDESPLPARPVDGGYTVSLAAVPGPSRLLIAWDYADEDRLRPNLAGAFPGQPHPASGRDGGRAQRLARDAAPTAAAPMDATVLKERRRRWTRSRL
ncbi:MAG: hypothetical protein U0793_12050 [Gemmataceae bacterium]